MDRRNYATLAVASFFLLVCAAHAGRRSSDSQESVSVGGVTRNYLLHVPRELPAKPAPLVLVFHGGGGQARNMPNFTKFDALSDAQGFVVAYPDSFNKSWSDTRGLSPADDVGFIRTLIAHLEMTLNLDPKRVYATGISNGGFFSQRLACDLADKLAAVASVAATMPETLAPVCKPARPISVMFIQGARDPIVHMEGGAILRDRGRNISLKDAVKFWTSFDQTSDSPLSATLPVQVNDGTLVHKNIYAGGKQRTEVVVYLIEGGGHAWPGGPQYLPAFLVGKASKNLDATRTIWDFFQGHSLP